MSYCLSFSAEFFTGDGMDDYYSMKPSDRPTSVLQAIISLPKAELVAIAREVLNSPHPYLAVMAEGFAWDVLDHIQEVNTCADLSSPVEVYIDSDGWHTVSVYDPQEEEE